MITMTFGDAVSPGFTNEDERGYWYCVYVVRSEDGVLYVGESYEPRERLRQHRSARTDFGMWIRENKQNTGHWIVTMYTLGDFGIPVKQMSPSMSKFKNHARAVERQLIIELDPIFNNGLR